MKHEIPQSTALFAILLGIFMMTLAFLYGFFIFDLMRLATHEDQPTLELESEVVIDSTPVDDEASACVSSEEKVNILPISFQDVIDSWAQNTPGNKSALVYDLDRKEIAGSYNIEATYSMASLYKLFVVYEGYRRISSGEWSGEMPAGSTGHTIEQCLDLAIRESNSACAETIWKMLGRKNLDNIVKNDFGATDSTVSQLISTPKDIAKIMELFYRHQEIDETLVPQIKDSFLNQPITIYNWRQGLPSGFSQANVYNKVGWDYNPEKNYWNIYHDAAIVEFPEQNRHFIVVVMSNFVPFQRIRDLGTAIENKFLDSVE